MGFILHNFLGIFNFYFFQTSGARTCLKVPKICTVERMRIMQLLHSHQIVTFKLSFETAASVFFISDTSELGSAVSWMVSYLRHEIQCVLQDIYKMLSQSAACRGTMEQS